jgi:hypothetical protein
MKEGTFSFRKEVPIDLQHDYYCQGCYASTVEPELESYAATMEAAKGVFFFFDTQKKPIPVLGKGTAPVEVAECVDRNETILRLGFQAAEQGFNAVMGAVVEGSQVRNHGWQKTAWRGRGMPAQVDAERLEKHLYLE